MKELERQKMVRENPDGKYKKIAFLVTQPPRLATSKSIDLNKLGPEHDTLMKMKNDTQILVLTLDPKVLILVDR